MEDYILTKSLNCAAYIVFKTGFKCMPEVVESTDIDGFNTFRFNRSQAVLDAYNLYKHSKILGESLNVDIFTYNGAIKKCKELLRDYKQKKFDDVLRDLADK